MPTKLGPQSRLLLKALTLSLAVNGLMVVMSALGGGQGSRSFILRIADAIAAPPSAIAQHVFAPKEHSVGAFAAAAAEFLMWSIAFYAIIAAAILETVSVCRRMAGKDQGAQR